MTPAEIIRDFKTKYLNTYVWMGLPESGKEVLCRIDAIIESRDRQAVIQLSSTEYGKLVINFASNNDMKFRFPTVGSFQYGKDSIVVRRRAPHRQYSRGLGAANHVMHVCTEGVVDFTAVEMNLRTIEAAFKAEKYRGSEALAILGRGKHRSVALAGMYSMSQPLDGGEMPFLFADTVFIGRVSPELEFIPYKGAEVFVPEVQQMLTEI